MLWWIFLLLIFVLLLILPVGLVARYYEQRWNVFLKIGAVKICLYPTRRNKKKPGTNPGTTKAQKKSTKQELHDFFPIFQSLFDFLADFRKSVRVNDLLIRIVLAGSDPCDVGAHYGYTCAAVANLLPLINRILYIKKQKIDVSCDYFGEQSIIDVTLDISLPMVLFLKMILQYGLRIFKHYHSIKTKEKAV